MSKTSFESSWQVIAEKLETDSLPDVLELKTFLYGSISFVEGYRGGGDIKKLKAWLDVVEQFLPVLVNRHKEWNSDGLQYSTVIVYLHHITFQIFHVKEIASPGLKQLGVAVFSLICAALSSEEELKQTTISNVSYKTYTLLWAHAQKLQKSLAGSSESSFERLQEVYELAFLATAVLNLDAQNTHTNGILTTRKFVTSLRHQLTSETEKSGSSEPLSRQNVEFISSMINLAVRSFVVQPHDLSSETSLIFFLELFALSAWHPALTAGLFACEGDLFKFKPIQQLLSYSDKGFDIIRARNHDASLLLDKQDENNTKDVVLSILRLSRIIVDSEVATAKQASRLDKELQKNDYFAVAVQQISDSFTGGPKLISAPVGDVLSIFARTVPHETKTTELMPFGALRLCHSVLSLAVRIFVRDMLRLHGKKENAASMRNKVCDLLSTRKTMAKLEQAIAVNFGSDAEKMRELSTHVKPCLTALTQLASRVNNKQLAEPDANLHQQQINKILQCAIFNIGSVGRNLDRQEKYESALAFLLPLWPVANVPELLQHVTYQETVATCYHKTGKIEKALTVIKTCAAIDPKLITNSMLKLLAKIADERADLRILGLFDPCAETPDKHAGIIKCASHVMITNAQTSKLAQQHIETLLQALCSHPGLSNVEQAVYTYLLAENVSLQSPNADQSTLVKCEGDSCKTENKSPQELINNRALNLAKEAMFTLASDETGKYSDWFAQAALLVWELLNRSSCMECLNQMPQSSDHTNESDEQCTTETSSSQAEQESLTRRQCPDAVDNLVDLNFDPSKKSKVKQPTTGVVHDTSSSYKTPSESSYCQVDAETLMHKASLCLSVWSSWFKVYGDGQGQMTLSDLDNFRIDKSLGFLNKVAELASSCHQPLLAVQALCQARQFSVLCSKVDASKRLTGSLASMLLQLGVPLEHGKSIPFDYEDEDNQWKCLFEQFELKPDCHVLQMAPVAGHLLYSGQVKKFLRLRAHILHRVAEQRRKATLTPNCTFTLCVIHRLTAQLYASSAAYDEDVIEDMKRELGQGQDVASDNELEPYPIDSGSDSLKYIRSVAMFLLGDGFKRGSHKSSSVETWHVIHEYLSTVLVQGELFTLAGNMRYAKTYFTEGLQIARSFLMLSWSTIFLSRLAEISMEIVAAVGETHILIMQSQLVIDAYRQHGGDHGCDRGSRNAAGVMGSDSHNCLYKLNRDELTRGLTDVPNEAGRPSWAYQLKDLKEQTSSETGTHSSNNRKDLSQSQKEQLSSAILEDVHKMKYPLNCDLCHQPKVADAVARLLCIRAELCARAQVDENPRKRCLQLAHDSTNILQDKSTLIDSLTQALTHGGLCHFLTNTQDIGSRTSLSGSKSKLSVLARKAEMKYRNLYSSFNALQADSVTHENKTCSRGKIMTSANDKMNCRAVSQENVKCDERNHTEELSDVKSMLDKVEEDSKEMTHGLSDYKLVLETASAQLMKMHLDLLPLLKKQERDSVKIDKAGSAGMSDVSSDDEIISSAVTDAWEDRCYWRKATESRLNLQAKPDSLLSQDVTNPFCKDKRNGPVFSVKRPSSKCLTQASATKQIKSIDAKKNNGVLSSSSVKGQRGAKHTHLPINTPLRAGYHSKEPVMVFNDSPTCEATPLKSSTKPPRTVKTTAQKRRDGRALPKHKLFPPCDHRYENKENHSSSSCTSKSNRNSISPLSKELCLLNINEQKLVSPGNLDCKTSVSHTNASTSRHKSKTSGSSDSVTSRCGNKSNLIKSVDIGNDNYSFVSSSPVVSVSKGKQRQKSVKLKDGDREARTTVSDQKLTENNPQPQKKSGNGRRLQTKSRAKKPDHNERDILSHEVEHAVEGNIQVKGGKQAKGRRRPADGVDELYEEENNKRCSLDPSPEKIRKSVDGDERKHSEDDSTSKCSDTVAVKKAASSAHTKRGRPARSSKPTRNKTYDIESPEYRRSLQDTPVSNLLENTPLDKLEVSLDQDEVFSGSSLLDSPGINCSFSSSATRPSVDSATFVSADETPHAKSRLSCVSTARNRELSSAISDIDCVYQQNSALNKGRERHTSFNLSEFMSEADGSLLSYSDLSPMEIPRGRPQRKKATQQNMQETKSPDIRTEGVNSPEEEDIITRSPEDTTRKRQILLGTPASKVLLSSAAKTKRGGRQRQLAVKKSVSKVVKNDDDDCPEVERKYGDDPMCLSYALDGDMKPNSKASFKNCMRHSAESLTHDSDKGVEEDEIKTKTCRIQKRRIPKKQTGKNLAADIQSEKGLMSSFNDLIPDKNDESESLRLSYNTEITNVEEGSHPDSLLSSASNDDVKPNRSKDGHKKKPSNQRVKRESKEKDNSSRNESNNLNKKPTRGKNQSNRNIASARNSRVIDKESHGDVHSEEDDTVSLTDVSDLKDKVTNLDLSDIENDELLVEDEIKVASKLDSISGMDSKCVGHLATTSSVSEDSSTPAQTMTAMFPTLAYSTKDLPQVDVLVETINKLCFFPPSFLYSQICKTVGRCLWEYSLLNDCDSLHTRIASYLTASLHITYQHTVTRNLRTKLRKMSKEKSKSSSSGVSTVVDDADNASDDDDYVIDEAHREEEKRKLSSALQEVTFGKCPEEMFSSRLSTLPPDYTVVQLTVSDLDPIHPTEGQGQMLITFMTSDLAPVTVGVPFNRMTCLNRAMRVLDKVIKHDDSMSTKEEYWMQRFNNDTKLKTVVDYLQLKFLSSHICLMQGRVAELRERNDVKALLDTEAKTAVASVVKEVSGDDKLDISVVRTLLEVLLFASECDMQSLLACMWSESVVRCLVQSFMITQEKLLGTSDASGKSWSKVKLQDRLGETRDPVILILDKTLTKLPWESMMALQGQTVTRVPSLASLCHLLQLHSERVMAPERHGTDRHDAVAVVDPESNLKFSVDFLLPQIQQIQGWTCLAQKPPTVSDLKAILTEHSLYMYVGHGWGNKYVGGDDLQMFNGKAVAVVMGCHSNNLEHHARVDGDGAPLYFMLAGCPAVVGNLWLVTDKDIDKLTSDLIKQWMSPAATSVDLSQSLTWSRRACRLVALNGFAPVIYGLPVRLVNKKRMG